MFLKVFSKRNTKLRRKRNGNLLAAALGTLTLFKRLLLRIETTWFFTEVDHDILGLSVVFESVFERGFSWEILYENMPAGAP